MGALGKIEEHAHNVGTCYRCGTTVEPIVSEQWFVSMKPLAEPAIEAVRSGKVKFVPERFSKIYFNWMENIRIGVFPDSCGGGTAFRLDVRGMRRAHRSQKRRRMSARNAVAQS